MMFQKLKTFNIAGRNKLTGDKLRPHNLAFPSSTDRWAIVGKLKKPLKDGELACQ